jgi:hypothetical protein
MTNNKQRMPLFKAFILASVLSVGTLCVYAACTSNASSSSQTAQYVPSCGCSYTKWTTDSAGNSAADQATCLTCPTQSGGCESTTGEYAEAWSWSCSGFNNGSNCGTVSCGTGTKYTHVAKYRYLSAGCGS